jgi:peptidoglycan hydrolase-like protein with peptidoglycan-binding domain
MKEAEKSPGQNFDDRPSAGRARAGIGKSNAAYRRYGGPSAAPVQRSLADGADGVTPQAVSPDLSAAFPWIPSDQPIQRLAETGVDGQEDAAVLPGSRPGSRKSSMEAQQPGKDSSARFAGDNELQGIQSGKETLSKGAQGVKVVKMQQALIDMGYKLPKYGVDGKFGDETLAALLAYQKDAKVPETGQFDKATIEKMDTRFDTRADYLQAADDFDKADPNAGTRSLEPDQTKAALDALKPQPGAPGAKFQETVGGKKYGDEIKARLAVLIPALHKELYADKKPRRADPKKNFHEDKALEDAANAGKDATDQVYGDLNKGSAFKMNANLIDQWQDEEDRNKLLDASEKKTKARHKVEYLINANCAKINRTFNANPSGKEEHKILAPIVESFIDTPAKAQVMLDIETGWEGAQLQGVQYLQLYKNPDAEVNRLRLWELFHVSIHEYIHTLAHADYKIWAEKLGGSQEHTLIEGFCDFFTMNVRARFPPSALKSFKKQVEGDFHDPGKAVPDTKTLKVGVYSSNQEAERMVGVVGIRNAQLGYFQGKTKLMGA